MLPAIEAFRAWILSAGAEQLAAGRDCQGLLVEVAAAAPSYDRLWDLAQQLADAPRRPDWPWREPEDLLAIRAACPNWPGTGAALDSPAVRARIRAAFLARVCGCILGKPIEVNPTYEQLRAAGISLGQWPPADYLSERFLQALGARNPSAADTTRETISYAAADDDLNYTILAMLTLEQHGRDFTVAQLAQLWFVHVPCGWQYGPERTMNSLYALGTQTGGWDWQRAGEVANVGSELCGALIRADAYGYACPGLPGRAAELAHRDASYTHRRTGVYGAMFVAAAIAWVLAAGPDASWRDIAAAGRAVVPDGSRLAHTLDRSVELVAAAADWEAGARSLNAAFGAHTHCQIHQEIGTLLNTLRFAVDVGSGICLQVAQGNDTDSFGATAGSILGAWKGPDALEHRWLAPFRDEIRTGLAGFPEHSLSALADRMSRLPDA